MIELSEIKCKQEDPMTTTHPQAGQHVQRMSKKGEGL